MSPKGNTAWITVILQVETNMAWMVDAGLDKHIWIPKSQILDYSEEEYTSGDCIEIELPEWLATEKGLI